MIRTHALFTRLTRRTTLPTVPKLVKIIGAAWAVTLVVAALPIWRLEAITRPAVALTQALGFGLMIVIPPITAGYAALIASFEAERPVYRLIQLTLLPRMARVMDLHHAALYRLRWLYAGLACVFPALMISGFYTGMTTGRDAISSSGIMIFAGIVWFGLAALVGSALGVYLRFRHHPAPLVAAPVLLIGFMGLGALLLVCPFYFAAPIALTTLLNQAEKYA